MPVQYPLSMIVLALALMVYTWTGMRVGAARGRYQIPAPAEDGPPEFRRVFRVHMNTLEQLVFFMPSLGMFALAWGDTIAAAIGVFWPLGRILYAVSYYKAAEKRGPGFGLSFLSAAILLIGGLAGAVMSLT